MQKQIVHVSQDVADPNLLYLQYGLSAFEIGLVQNIEVEWALKYLNWEKKGGTMTNKFNVGGGGTLIFNLTAGTTACILQIYESPFKWVYSEYI